MNLIELILGPYHLFNWVADFVFHTLATLFQLYGAPIVFLAATAEATVGLGLLVPGVIMIFLAGAYAREEQASIVWMFTVATTGTLIGDTVSYAFGRWGGERVRGTRFGPALRMGEALVSGHARWLIPFYHLNSVSRTLGPFGAGALRMPLRIWMPLDYFGAVVANAIWIGAGAIFGRALLQPDGTLADYPPLRIGLVLALVFYAFIIRTEMKKARRQREADRRLHAVPPPSE